MAEPDLTALGLPHRPPFVFVRRLIDCQPGESTVCVTSFPAADPMFAGHFPGNPLIPGVIITEALAQTAGIAFVARFAENARRFFLVSAIQKMMFFGPAQPEEEILLKAEKVAHVGDLWQF